MPRDAVKKFEGVPLIRTTKFAEVRQPIIQLIVRSGTPIWIKMSHKAPIHTVKCLDKIQFENEGTDIF